MSGTAQKLTQVKVDSVREMLSQGLKQRYIAMLLHISQHTVSGINTGKYWNRKQ